MTAEFPRRRVLLAAPDGVRADLRPHLPADAWAVTEASSVEQARFQLTARAGDVVVVEGSLAGADWSETLGWLARQVLAPLVVVSGPSEEVVLPALRQGASWLPLDLARRQPDLLVGLLEQAAWLGHERRHAGLTTDALEETRNRVDRLLTLLWEAAPGVGPAHWYSQRHMLDRLDEEIARSHRHGLPLSVVLGRLSPTTREAGDERRVASWMAAQVSRNKRRCDVVGHYGLDSFLMLLPQAEATQANGAARRLGKILADPPHDLPRVHARFGVASVPADVGSLPGLLRRAEDRLERAAESGEGIGCA